MKSLKTTSAILLTAFALNLVLTVPLSAEKIKLRMNLKQGKRYNISFVADQDISQTIQSRKQDIKQTFGIGFTYDVQSVEKEVYTIKVTYSWIRFSQEGPGQNMDYDSRDSSGEIPAAAKGFAGMVDQSFTIQVSPTGKVKKIEGTEKIIDKIIASLDATDEAAKEYMRSSIKKHFGEKALKNQIESSFNIYPEQPVAPGDSWKKEIATNVGFPMLTTNTYTLKKTEKNIAEISVASKVETNEHAEPMKMGQVEMKYEIRGMQEGDMKVDIETGLVKASTLKQRLSGKISISGNGNKNTAWPISIYSKINISME